MKIFARVSRPRRPRPGWVGRRPGLTAAVVSVAAAGVVTLTPTAASAAPAFGFGYVWANQPTTASYTPSSAYNRNSTGALNTVIRAGAGRYTVVMPNLGLIGGTVHATAYGSSAQFCSVVSWFPSGANLDVNVNCYLPSGIFSDSLFDASFVNASAPGGQFAYLWANNPTTASYTPSTLYQFNSTGGTNTVVRAGTGVYQAVLPGLGAAAGHVQVTAYNPTAARCTVGGWGPSGTAQVITVRCFSVSGFALDTRFTLTYTRSTSILRSSPGAYGWANQPTTSAYIPSLTYAFNSTGGINTVQRLGTGIYRVETFGQPLGNGDVQVTAYGVGSGQHCKVVFWAPTSGIQVRCFTATGTLTDALFDASFAF